MSAGTFEPWQNKAACGDYDPALFDLPEHPERSDQPSTGRRLDAAQAVCKRCPVVDKCLTDAIKHRDSGVRGGHVLHHGQPYRAGVVDHRQKFPTDRPHSSAKVSLGSGAAVPQTEVASLAAIARDEQARIYGELVPEYHGNAQPRPASETVWERARLHRAARKLRGDA